LRIAAAEVGFLGWRIVVSAAMLNCKLLDLGLLLLDFDLGLLLLDFDLDSRRSASAAPAIGS
jgi:hypothetical protein